MHRNLNCQVETICRNRTCSSRTFCWVVGKIFGRLLCSHKKTHKRQNIINGVIINQLALLMAPIKLNQFRKGREGLVLMADRVNATVAGKGRHSQDIPRQLTRKRRHGRATTSRLMTALIFSQSFLTLDHLTRNRRCLDQQTSRSYRLASQVAVPTFATKYLLIHRMVFETLKSSALDCRSIRQEGK